MHGRQDQMPFESDIMDGHQVQDDQVSFEASHHNQNKAVHRLRGAKDQKSGRSI